MARLSHGGPGLTNASFHQGINQIQQTLTDNHNATLAFERDRAHKTLAKKHGDALAERIMRLCNVTQEIDLAEVHTLLLKTSKPQTYAVLTSLFAE